MRKFLMVLFVCMLAIPLAAQSRTGNIYGTVQDDEGNPLPGVTVTCTHATIAPMVSVTSESGVFRFLSLFPSSTYVLKAEMGGFKTKVETGVIVNVGVNSNITIVMEVGALEEEVTVVATTPVVTPKRTQITHTVNLEMLQSLPSARDPWVILQMLPSVLVDRENVGGSESGQQSGFVSKGETTDSWVMDGIQITDMNAIASPGYWDLDTFEEISVTTGMTDVEHRERSIVISFVSKRGGNRFSFGGRFYLTDEWFQANQGGPYMQELREIYSEANGYPKGAGYNRIRNIKDFGFNMGGPLVKDKAWWWGSYGVQQIQTTVITGTNDDTYLNNMAFKLNFQLFTGNRFEFFIHAGEKEKFGRGSSTANPPGRNQHGKYQWGSPILKIQDEHMFGDNLFVSVRYGFYNGGFGMWPALDEDISVAHFYDYTNDIYQRPDGVFSYSSYFFSGRPHSYIVAQGIYYLDDLFGTSHEIKLGAELNNNWRTYVGGNGGNFSIYHSYDFSYFDEDRNGTRDVPSAGWMRMNVGNNDVFYEDGTDRTAFYLQDIISVGRFNFNLQLRADREVDYYQELTTRSLYTEDVEGDWHDNYYELARQYFASDVGNDVVSLISGMMVDRTRPYSETPDDFKFWTFSPRIGVTYDVFGDGKTIAKAAFAIYPGGPLDASNWRMSGVYPWMRFWNSDAVSGTVNVPGDPFFGQPWGNNDGVMDLNEIWWVELQGSRLLYRPIDPITGAVTVTTAEAERDKGLMWGGFEWTTPTELVPNYDFVDPNWKHHLDYDILLSIEREIFADFGVGLDFTYRWDKRRSWELAYYPEYDNGGELTPFGDNVRRQGLDPLDPDYIDPASPNAFPPGRLEHIREQDDYMAAGTIPIMIYGDSPGEDDFSTQEAAGREWYVLKDEPQCGYTDYGWDTNRPDRHDKYWGVDLRWNKRFSNKWMLNGSITLQMQKAYYGDNGWVDPTSLWAFDKQMYSNYMGGGSGKISVPMFTRWMFKLQGMYALPYGFNVSGTINGREGQLVDEYFTIADFSLPNPRSQTSYMELTTNENEPRLPDMWVVNLKVEKMLTLGDTGKVWISADLFNALNNQTLNRQRDGYIGRYNVTDPLNPRLESYNRRYMEPNETLNPLVVRFGIRFQF